MRKVQLFSKLRGVLFWKSSLLVRSVSLCSSAVLGVTLLVRLLDETEVCPPPVLVSYGLPLFPTTLGTTGPLVSIIITYLLFIVL